MRSKIETANQPDGGLKMEENWLSRRIMGQKRRVITGISTFFCASRVCVWCCCDSYQVWFETRRSNSCYQATDSTLPAAGSFPKKSSQDARLFLLNFFLKKCRRNSVSIGWLFLRLWYVDVKTCDVGTWWGPSLTWRKNFKFRRQTSLRQSSIFRTWCLSF